MIQEIIEKPMSVECNFDETKYYNTVVTGDIEKIEELDVIKINESKFENEYIINKE